MPNRKENYKRFYFVYLMATDELLCCGAGPECAEALGMKWPIFRQTVSNVRAGRNRKYEIYVEGWDDE